MSNHLRCRTGQYKVRTLTEIELSDMLHYNRSTVIIIIVYYYSVFLFYVVEERLVNCSPFEFESIPNFLLQSSCSKDSFYPLAP